jgi:hypothetical protein
VLCGVLTVGDPRKSNFVTINGNQIHSLHSRTCLRLRKVSWGGGGGGTQGGVAMP